MLYNYLEPTKKIIQNYFYWVYRPFRANLRWLTYESSRKIDISIMQIQIFKFKEKEVRTKIINGKEYFCASDVCGILKYKNGRKAIEDHCNKQGVTKCDTLTKGGNQELSYINEPNLYRLIARSTMPSAVEFERWIFEEVLPQIRKTGGYNIEKISMKELAYKIIEIEEQKEKLQQTIEQQDKQITYYDDMLVAEGTFCLQNGAKALHLKPNKFIEALRMKGFLMKDNIAKQMYINSGLFATKIITHNNKENIKKEKLQTMITTKGIVYFAKVVLKEFVDILDKPTSKKIFEKIKANDKDAVVLKLLDCNL